MVNNVLGHHLLIPLGVYMAYLRKDNCAKKVIKLETGTLSKAGYLCISGYLCTAKSGDTVLVHQ